MRALAEQALEALGGLDILVNCAAQPGGAPPRPGIEHLPDENFLEQMNVKVLGYTRCARAVVYDSPVFCMRPRTRRLKSLSVGMA